MCHICDKTKIFYEKLKRHQKYKLRGYNYFKRGGKMKILVVDDNKNINDVLIKYCKREGYETIAAYDGEEAVDIYEKEKLDLILLDVMLPKLDGFEVCKIIREKSNIPIIMITAKSEDMDRIIGLDIGADDYIIKPFSPAEVMARIRAIMRRIGREIVVNTNKNIIKYGNLNIDIDRYSVFVDEYEVSLTKKEKELLIIMATSPNKVFTRNNLLDCIWGSDYYGDIRTVDTHIKRLRAKLDKFGKKDWDILTVRGVGYKFEAKK